MKEKVLAFLTQAHIPFEVTQHPAVYTMAQMEALGLDRLGPIPKNLFVRDGKGRQHFLITAAKDTPIDLKELGDKLGVKKLSFASAERLQTYLGVTAGCVSPFGVLNDCQNAVTVVFDSALADLPKIGVHPNKNDSTIWISFQELYNAIQLAGNPVRIVDL